jgi:hypothetical protein
MAELIIEIVGWVGMVLVLFAYLSITLDKLDRESKFYHGMNLIGALLIGVNSIINSAYPSGVLNVLWMIIAIYGFIK